MLEGCYCGRCRPDLIGTTPRISSEERMERIVKNLAAKIIEEIDKAVIEELCPIKIKPYFNVQPIYITAEELVEFDLKNRKRDLKFFKENPTMRMPVFVGRGNPKYKVKWNDK